MESGAERKLSGFKRMRKKPLKNMEIWVAKLNRRLLFDFALEKASFSYNDFSYTRIFRLPACSYFIGKFRFYFGHRILKCIHFIV